MAFSLGGRADGGPARKMVEGREEKMSRSISSIDFIWVVPKIGRIFPQNGW